MYISILPKLINNSSKYSCVGSLGGKETVVQLRNMFLIPKKKKKKSCNVHLPVSFLIIFFVHIEVFREGGALLIKYSLFI